MMSPEIRRARVRGPGRVIASYLPANYSIVATEPPDIHTIEGHDVAGWTLDDYVIPRLASGLYFAEEIK